MYRVFYDRLVDDKDRAWLHRYVTCGFVLPCMSPVIVSDSCLFLFCSLLKTVTKEHLKDDFDSLFKRLSSDNKSVSTIEFFFLFCEHYYFDIHLLLSHLQVFLLI